MDAKRVVITVDGSAASGKSALAEQLARALKFKHINTGLLYRAIGWGTIQRGGNPGIEGDAMAVLNGASLDFTSDSSTGEIGVTLNGRALRDELTLPDVSRAASLVATHAAVRAALLPIQREAFPMDGLVAEGRDMGTVVFPDAALKFFITARLEVRAARRYKQLSAKGQDGSLVQITKDIAERDERDAGRAIAPLKEPEGAIVIDNSDDPLEITIERMISLARTRGTRL